MENLRFVQESCQISGSAQQLQLTYDFIAPGFQLIKLLYKNRFYRMRGDTLIQIRDFFLDMSEFFPEFLFPVSHVLNFRFSDLNIYGFAKSYFYRRGGVFAGSTISGFLLKGFAAE